MARSLLRLTGTVHMMRVSGAGTGQGLGLEAGEKMSSSETSAAKAALGSETAAAQVSTQGMMRAARVLIVDEDPLLQKSLALVLTLRGYEVEAALTAHNAIEAFSRRRPDLVVLDLGLPDRGGTEVCLRVRQESAVPIIVLSASAGDEDKITALEQWVGDYISKPFSS